LDGRYAWFVQHHDGEMSFSVSLEVRATGAHSGVDRPSLASFIDTLAVPPDQEIEIDLLPDPGEATDDRVLAVSIGGPGVAYEQAMRVAFVLADHLRWSVFDNERGAYVPRWELDAPVGLRPALATWRSGLSRAPKGWLVRRFLFHLPPRDAVSVAFYAFAGVLSSKGANWLWAPAVPIWGGPGVVCGALVAIGLLALAAASSVLGEVTTREMERRWGAVQQPDAADERRYL
jgi:hypothetical protein